MRHSISFEKNNHTVKHKSKDDDGNDNNGNDDDDDEEGEFSQFDEYNNDKEKYSHEASSNIVEFKVGSSSPQSIKATEPILLQKYDQTNAYYDEECNDCRCDPAKCQETNNCDIDTDADGIPDCYDKCPNQEGLDAYGCPPCDDDTDGDGIEDCKDECPDVQGETANGCPEEVWYYFDRDGDDWYSNRVRATLPPSISPYWNTFADLGIDCDDNNPDIKECETISTCSTACREGYVSDGNCGCVPVENQMWFYDGDGDDYHSDKKTSTGPPDESGFWSTTSEGPDCDDTKSEFTTVCCPKGQILDGNGGCKFDPCLNKDLRHKEVADNVRQNIESRLQESPIVNPNNTPEVDYLLNLVLFFMLLFDC